MVTLTMNGKKIIVEDGVSILEAARENGVDIPTLCYDKELSPFGGCRLCVVEVEGSKNLVASCSAKVKEGMVVYTESERVIKTRREILDLLYSNHPQDCLTCEKSGECQLQDLCYRYGIKEGS
ncbi:MAG TPA: formate dehydrogenase subunit alpha, partial [Tissierella sp.]|nr:formate dehydrogenase subunit alpha [Tissierella sp.]